jgi:hypothetical protein
MTAHHPNAFPDILDDAVEPPAWQIGPSPFDWQVMVFGGDNPRTGFPQPPLEFQFYAGHYSRRQIEQRAADLCEREHRLLWQVRAPCNRQVGRLG